MSGWTPTLSAATEAAMDAGISVLTALVVVLVMLWLFGRGTEDDR